MRIDPPLIVHNRGFRTTITVLHLCIPVAGVFVAISAIFGDLSASDARLMGAVLGIASVVTSLSSLMLWRIIFRWQDKNREDRYGLLIELDRREEAWEADRSELIATACQTVWEQLQRERGLASTDEAPRLRIVRWPPGDNENRAG